MPLHLLTSSTYYSDILWLIIQNPLVAGIVMQLTAVVSTPKYITLIQMANDVQLLPYSAQFIIRSVPSLQGSVILLGSSVRQCSHEARD